MTDVVITGGYVLSSPTASVTVAYKGMQVSDLSYSERERGERPRDRETIDMRVWKGIEAKIAALVRDGSFGVNYPSLCPDGGSDPVGTDESSFRDAMHAEIPELEEETDPLGGGGYKPPPTHAIMDMIEFCWRNVGKPIVINRHNYYNHSHLIFDVEAGRVDFFEQINTIFRRNGLAYELKNNGKVERLIAPVLNEIVASSFHTGDNDLDKLLETAQKKFLDPHVDMRREALQSLWDAWERLKTTFDPSGNKKKGVTYLLNLLGSGDNGLPRTELEEEAKKLTFIGNEYFIRHTEIDQKKVSDSKHVDYLFYRLFSFIYLVIKTKGMDTSKSR
ncbi:MAG: hypothetical protein OYH77_03000 [Pseudomonadota bacterium]|nr:hypothetical protein [Pseudomonadota bacterium]